MRRTLLAVGIAVLASMLLTPHQNGWNFLQWAFDVQCDAWRWFPIFWLENNDIAWINFGGQTAFVALLAVVVVNLRKRRTTQRKLEEKP